MYQIFGSWGDIPLALCPTGRLIIDIFHFGTPPGCEVRRILKTKPHWGKAISDLLVHIRRRVKNGSWFMVNGSWLEDFSQKAWKIQNKFVTLHPETK